MARQLERLGVDVIEAGFPIASPGDFEAVQADRRGGPGRQGRGPLPRPRRWTSRPRARRSRARAHPVIHTFLATSGIHLKWKLKITPGGGAASRRSRACGSRARFCRRGRVLGRGRLAHRLRLPAARCSRPCFEAGARTPQRPRHRRLRAAGRVRRDGRASCVRDIPGAVISVHCHNDLGLAVANSLAAVAGGRAPGRVHDQRHRRARRQHLARGDRDGAQGAPRGAAGRDRASGASCSCRPAPSSRP